MMVVSSLARWQHKQKYNSQTLMAKKSLFFKVRLFSFPNLGREFDKFLCNGIIEEVFEIVQNSRIKTYPKAIKTLYFGYRSALENQAWIRQLLGSF